MATKKTTKKAPAKKAPTKKVAKKAPAKKAPTKKAAEKAPAKKVPRRLVRMASAEELGPIQKVILASRRDGNPKFWLVKSEPDVYSIDQLARDGETTWEGVRNYTARNFMRDGMSLGDLVLYYHSNAEPPGIVGIGKISGMAEPDPFQFDSKSPYYDAAAKKDDPRWLMVRVAFVEKFPTLISLDRLREDPSLSSMLVVQKGQRLSVQPVEKANFDRVRVLGRAG